MNGRDVSAEVTLFEAGGGYAMRKPRIYQGEIDRVGSKEV
jgi:hypothetical protein